MRGQVWVSLCLALGRYGRRIFTRAELLNAAIVGEVFSGAASTNMATADADSIGVVVCSSSVAAPPLKLFGNVAKNSVNAS